MPDYPSWEDFVSQQGAQRRQRAATQLADAAQNRWNQLDRDRTFRSAWPAARTRAGTWAPPALPALANQAVTEGQTNQIANQAINQLTTGANERMRMLRERFAGTGAEGALNDEQDQVLNETALASQQARTDAALESARRNADWALAKRAAELQARGQDIEAHQGERRLSLDEGDLALRRELGVGDLGLRERSLGQERELELSRQGLQRTLGLGDLGLRRAGLRQEGELERGRQGLQRELGYGDLGLRERGLTQEGELTRARLAQESELERGRQGLQRELGYGDLGLRERGLRQEGELERGRQGLQARGQNLEFDTSRSRQALDWLQSLLGAGVTTRGQNQQYELGRGSQALAGRGQDLEYALQSRGQDIDWQRLLGQLAMEGAGLGVTQRGQDLSVLERQLGLEESANQAQQQRNWDLILAMLGRGGR